MIGVAARVTTPPGWILHGLACTFVSQFYVCAFVDTFSVRLFGRSNFPGIQDRGERVLEKCEEHVL